MRHEALLEWLGAREPTPPPGLARAIQSAVMAADIEAVVDLPKALAEAALAALDRVASAKHQGRPLAVELLAADALVTYALEAQLEAAPEGLAGFAGELARRAGAGR